MRLEQGVVLEKVEEGEFEVFLGGVGDRQEGGWCGAGGGKRDVENPDGRRSRGFVGLDGHKRTDTPPPANGNGLDEGTGEPQKVGKPGTLQEDRSRILFRRLVRFISCGSLVGGGARDGRDADDVKVHAAEALLCVPGKVDKVEQMQTTGAVLGEGRAEVAFLQFGDVS